ARDVVGERFQRLVDLHGRLSLESNAAMVGRTIEVLSEGPSRKDPLVATTRSRGGKVVHVVGDRPIGTFHDVTITQAAQHHLVGSPL
ncbi:MAG TPA: TRAM domain-containing protein, partial [Acidimicrobiia bacterium]